MAVLLPASNYTVFSCLANSCEKDKKITGVEKKIQLATKYQRARVRASKKGLDPAWPGPWTVYLSPHVLHVLQGVVF